MQQSFDEITDICRECVERDGDRLPGTLGVLHHPGLSNPEWRQSTKSNTRNTQGLTEAEAIAVQNSLFRFYTAATEIKTYLRDARLPVSRMREMEMS
jgi:hypothetical protein